MACGIHGNRQSRSVEWAIGTCRCKKPYPCRSARRFRRSVGTAAASLSPRGGTPANTSSLPALSTSCPARFLCRTHRKACAGALPGPAFFSCTLASRFALFFHDFGGLAVLRLRRRGSPRSQASPIAAEVACCGKQRSNRLARAPWPTGKGAHTSCTDYPPWCILQ